MSTSGRCWLPGPVEVDTEPAQAMLAPVISHRGTAGEALAARLQQGLRSVFQTERPVCCTTGSGTAMMEAALRSGVHDRVLCLVQGHFGERFARIAEACDKEVIRLCSAPDRALDPEAVEQMLDGPPVDAITVVHVESSTGAVTPIEKLLPVLARFDDAITIVDAVASLGGIPVPADRWQADLVLSASQKALGAPAGLAMAVPSERFLARAREVEDRGLYLDIISLYGDAVVGRFPQTPPLPIVHALVTQLQRIGVEGLEQRWQRHSAMRQLLEEWVALHDDIEFLIPAGQRANTVSVLRLGGGRSASALVALMLDDGWQLAAGVDDPTDSLIRIGHLGDNTPAQLKLLLTALGQRLAP